MQTFLLKVTLLKAFRHLIRGFSQRSLRQMLLPIKNNYAGGYNES